MRFSSPCKINLHLGITGKLPNGYHTLETIFTEVPWYDYITITPNDSGEIVVKSSIKLCDMEDNLCYKGAKLLKDYIGFDGGCEIYLEKHLPFGAGLGGGSANCATVLKALNSIWNLNLNSEKLKSLGVKLGADIPFFIDGGTAIATGIGDQLSSIENRIKDLYLLIIYKNIHISTPWAYKSLNFSLTERKSCTTFSAVALRGLEMGDLINFYNDFEPAVFRSFPEIESMITNLNQHGAFYSRMSGSGSSVFGLFKSIEDAEKAETFFKKEKAKTKLIKI